MFVSLTKEEAIQIVNEQSCEITDQESSNFGRVLIHHYYGFSFMGCDYDKDKVIEMIQRSEAVGWAVHPMRHNLCVIVDGERHNFNAHPSEGFDFQVST